MRIGAQGPEEICLSLEHQNPSKTSEKMSYFDRVTVRQRGYGLRLLIFKMANDKVDLVR